MNRRAFLAGASATVAIAVSGCVGTGTLVGDTSTSADENRIASHDFVGRDYTLDDPQTLLEQTRITADTEPHQVTITGAMEVGSSECDRVGLETIEYDAQTNKLVIVVRIKQKRTVPLLESCSGDMSVEFYRVEVMFTESLPATVEVTERYTESGMKPIETTTIERLDIEQYRSESGRSSSLPASELIITVITHDTGDEEGFIDHEYIELRNDGDSPLDLSGYTIQYADSRTYTIQKLTFEPGAVLILITRSGRASTLTSKPPTYLRYTADGGSVLHRGGGTVVVTSPRGDIVAEQPY